MRFPYAPLPFLVFIFILGLLLGVVQLGALTVAFDKLGLSPGSAFLLLFASLLGSAVNLPLFTMRAERPPEAPVPRPFPGLLRFPARAFTGRTNVAVNVGGCLMPLLFSLYLLGHAALPGWQVIAAIAAVTAISRLISRPIPGLGIGMPIFVAPFSAAAIAMLLNAEASAPLAYIGGTLGVLIGADLLRLDDIRRLGAPFASIGGAGTFDGIFITGIVAVLLA
ncbi:MAG: hypothetical protein A2151_02670 [Candidatus Muproteobacteria bacterium RBG_16_65_34]|uniref:DUF1614 domain-containing protein n=1 Tax=Candidatus Muproteobacteria bacterium RBG_16_65_34 TaxID=1817760 RepID=A0A1F6TTZ2_9PROT|nr:MAG: hypothetical protein A2151_02670 [Candidatus Muproteobacteria bacterium RBG_16_65_34]